jgi:hypothetical protein
MSEANAIDNILDVCGSRIRNTHSEQKGQRLKKVGMKETI